jgi:uncharacterized protein (TIGR03435 family)
MIRISASIGFAVLWSGAAFCQSAANKPAFDIADVHVSPRAGWANTVGNALQGGILNAGRYELHRATMLDLIKTAYAVDADKVYGGPSWLDYDKFEVIAKTQPGTRPEVLRLMLQSLLEDRFKLAVKKDTKPMPAYVLSVAKDKPNLRATEGSSSSGCQRMPPTPRTSRDDIPTGTIQCRNVTMEAFAAGLRSLVGTYFDNLPVVDSTGIEGTFDIDLKYPLRVISISASGAAPVVNSGGSIFEAIEKQLGLKLELGKPPQQVLSVESVTEQPAANPAGVETALPPLPVPQFEVASIRPCDGTGGSRTPQFEAGDRVTMNCMSLHILIDQVFNLSPSEEPAGIPKWMEADSRADYFSLVAKAPAGTFPNAASNAQARETLNAMMRALLEDRFKLATHYEDRPMDAYTLVAAKPKLTKADPESRTGCTRQNPPGAASLRLVCQNITMTQFAEQIRGYDPQIFYPVLDGTGIEGAWDFTLNYNLVLPLPPVLLAARAAATPGGAPADATDPGGAISFVQAIEKQLGLKLETHKRPEPVLVIDHIEEKPTEN